MKKIEPIVRPSYLADVMGVTTVYLRQEVFNGKLVNETNKKRIEYVLKLNEAIETITKEYEPIIKRQRSVILRKK